MPFRITPLLLLALSSTIFAGPILVESSDGRTISIEVVSLEGENVTFTTPGKSQTFTLALSRFAKISQDAIKKAATTHSSATANVGDMPPIKIDMVIGKRGTKEDSYMKSQTVTGKVKLTNPSSAVACPKSKAHVFFVGQDRENTSRLMVLSADAFEFQISRGGTYEFECAAFTTRFDSDNKGDGNIGGYQYKHYVIVLLDGAGNVVGCKSSSNDYQKLVEQDTELAKKVIKLKKDTPITEKLEAVTLQVGSE